MTLRECLKLLQYYQNINICLLENMQCKTLYHNFTVKSLQENLATQKLMNCPVYRISTFNVDKSITIILEGYYNENYG